MAAGSDSRIGTVLAGYRLGELLGRGGMGVVYRAHDDALERNVALKLVAPELASDAAFRDRFLVEARLAASIDHPNVVPVYDAGAIDGQLYLAMRFVEGSDLRGLLAEEGQLDPERALAVCGQVAAALDAAHRRGLVHRDVKPSNVLLDAEGHVYLADFGLTRRLSEQAPGFDAGLSLGTPAYVAPEQIEAAGGVEAVVGPRADQYSLACMLYECLAGAPPFPRGSESATLFAHLEEEPPSLPRLEGVLARGLAKDPEDRYESCTALVEAARASLPQTRRGRRLLVAVAALAAAVVVAAAVVLTGGDEPRVGHDWTRVPHIESVFGGTQGINPDSVASDGSRLVAVGKTGQYFEKASDIAVWTSTDGVTWARTAEASLAEAGWQGAYNVAAGPRGFVSIGTAGEIGYCDPEEKCSIDGAVWRSSDGTHWQRVPHDDDVFGPPDGGQVFMIDVVAAGELGFVATGIAPERVSGLPRPVVWTSRDGESWSREPVPPGPPLKSPVNRRDWFVVPRAVAGGANDGPVVAVGNEGHFPSPPQYSVAAAWVSADGQSWARVPHDDDAFGDGTGAPLSLADVTAGGPGFVAVGEVGAEEAAVDVLRTPGPTNLRAYILTSADGLSWTRVSAERLPGGGEKVALDSVTTGGPGLIASGWRRNNPGVADADVDPVVWTSKDGFTWTEAADPEDAFSQPGGQLIMDITSGGAGLVAVGLDGDQKGFNAVIWTSP